MSFIITSKSRGGATKPRSGPNTRFDQGFRNEFGLVGAWTLDSGPVMAWDLSGVGNHGRKAGTGSTIVNAASPHGRSLNFTGNGTDHDRFDLGPIASSNPLSLSSGDTVTIVWRSYLRTLDTRNNDYPRIFDKSNSGNAANGYAIWAVGTDNYRFMEDGSDSADSNASTTTDWENRAFTRNGTAAAFFLDGVDDTADNFTGAGNFSSTTTNAAIGHWNHSTTDRNWDGGIDYIYIFDQVLPDSIIARLASHPYEWITSTPRRTYFIPPAATTDSVFIVTSKSRAVGFRPQGAPVLNRASQQAEGLIGWFPNVQPENTRDYSGNNRHQTATVATPDRVVAPVVGAGASYVRASHESSVFDYDAFSSGQSPVDGAITCAVWVVPQSAHTSQLNKIAGFDKNNVPGTIDYGIIARDGKFGWLYNSGGLYHLGTTSYVLGQLYHVAITRDVATSGNLRAYVNGVLEVDETENRQGTSTADNWWFQIGKWYTGTHGFTGEVYDTRVWNRDLSPAEIWSLYDSQTRWDLYWQPRRTYFIPAAGATTTTSDVPASDITLTAQPPTSLRSLITNIPAV